MKIAVLAAMLCFVCGCDPVMDQIHRDSLYEGKWVTHRVSGKRALVTYLDYRAGVGELRVAIKDGSQVSYDVWSKHEVEIERETR